MLVAFVLVLLRNPVRKVEINKASSCKGCCQLGSATHETNLNHTNFKMSAQAVGTCRDEGLSDRRWNAVKEDIGQAVKPLL